MKEKCHYNFPHKGITFFHMMKTKYEIMIIMPHDFGISASIFGFYCVCFLSKHHKFMRVEKLKCVIRIADALGANSVNEIKNE